MVKKRPFPLFSWLHRNVVLITLNSFTSILWVTSKVHTLSLNATSFIWEGGGGGGWPHSYAINNSINPSDWQDTVFGGSWRTLTWERGMQARRTPIYRRVRNMRRCHRHIKRKRDDAVVITPTCPFTPGGDQGCVGKTYAPPQEGGNKHVSPRKMEIYMRHPRRVKINMRHRMKGEINLCHPKRVEINKRHS